MKSMKEQIGQKCVYFNGIQNKACKAGVVYDDLDRENRHPYRAGLPCMKKDVHLPAGAEQCKCEHLRFPTAEEAQKRLDEIQEAKNRITLAMEICAPIRKKQKGKNWSGSVECPVCKGALHLTHAAYNGHMWGQCETENCLSWME